MKLALTTDFIIERDYPLEIFEMVSDIEREAAIYTLSHQEGNILGPIELHQIRSSFLTHKLKDVRDFHKYAPLIPGACKNLFIPCQTDIIFCVSRGFAQGIKKCKDTRLIVYMVHDELANMKKGFKNWFFRGFLKKWQKKSLVYAHEIWFPSMEMAQSFELNEDARVKIVPLFFKASEYPIIPSPLFTYQHVVIGTSGLSSADAEKFYLYFKEKNIAIKFVGDLLHVSHSSFFNDLEISEREKIFFGERCAGELAPVLASAGLVIDLSDNSYPLLTLKSLSCGRPVVSLSSQLRDYYYQDIVGNGVETVDSQNFYYIINSIQDAYDRRGNYDAHELKKVVNNFSDAKFKEEVKRVFNN